MSVETAKLYIPPAVACVIKELERAGYRVAVRKNCNGSNRYSVNGARETDALTLMKRFEAAKYPPVEAAAPHGR